MNPLYKSTSFILIIAIIASSYISLTINERVRVFKITDLPRSSSPFNTSGFIDGEFLNDEPPTINSNSHKERSIVTSKQISLASLTLHQQVDNNKPREPRRALADNHINSNQVNDPSTSSIAAAPPASVVSTNNLHNNVKLTHILTSPVSLETGRDNNLPKNWQELSLERIRPSFLNVGRQFKITDESINEVTQSKQPSSLLANPDYILKPAFDSPILLRTKLGIIEGVRSVRFGKNLYTFLSIPYARPPLGELRFKAPERVEPWDGIYQATKWPPFCVQPSMTLASKSTPVHIMSQVMTEDCLYMNIWTPTLKSSRSSRRPVMVWLHGGAFQFGGISVDENDGSALASLGNVVVVTLNYRISAFGFLNSNNPKNGPNNVGLLDQRLALQWVQSNIRQFGGDPHQVTLFGESAGGHSVGLHMISPQSWPLFKRAILQSGVPTSMLRSYDINPDNTDGPTIGEGAIMVAKRLGCYQDSFNPSTSSNDNNEDEADGGNETNSSEPETGYSSTEDRPILSDQVIACLRNKTSLEILKATGTSGSSGFFPTGNDPNGFFPNGPVVQSFDASDFKVGPQKDYLIGTNTDEGTFMLHYGLPSIFPARDTPQVDNIEQLRNLIMNEIDQNSRKRKQDLQTTNSTNSRNAKVQTISASREELQSASGDNKGGAQGHLFKPLLRLRTPLVERFLNRKEHTNHFVVQTGNEASIKRAQFGRSIAYLISDIIFLCPSRTLARTLSDAKRNVYFYLYNHRSSISQYHPWMGVTHHDEVEFVFGRPLRMADIYSGDDIEMSQRMIKIWSQFAHSGTVPNQYDNAWPLYGSEENNYMRLDTRNASINQRYHDSFCNLYETVITVHLRDN